MLGRFFAHFFIDRYINRKAVISFFHQQSIAGIGAVETISRLIAAIHIDSGIGQIFGPIQPFTVDIAKKIAQLLDLTVKIRKCVTI